MKIRTISSLTPAARGLVLGLAATALSSFVAQGVPYASGIISNNNTVSFVLNQPAAGITVLRNGANPVSIDATAKGVKTFDMTGYTTYSIIVTGDTAKGWTQFSSDSLTQSKYYSPRGVHVDTNPKRSTFGQIIVAEGVAGSVAAGGRTTTDGLYIMSADQGDILGQGDIAFGGGVIWTNDHSPFKVSMNRNDPLGQDYTLYISDWSDRHSGIWTADALNPSAAFSELLDNTGRDTAGIVLEGGGVGPGQLHGSIPAGPWVEGIGANRVMYTVDEDVSMGSVLKYDIGTTTSGYSTAPTVWVDDGAVVANGLMDLVRDVDGTWWVTTYRWTDSDGAPSLSRWADNSFSPLWKSGPAIALNRAYGSIDISPYEDLLVIGSSRSVIYVVDIFDRDNPKLVNSIAHTGATIRDVAFDAAGNIYVVSPSSETLRIYSRGGYTVATTKSDGTFDLFRPAEVSVTATDNAATEDGDLATFKISRRFGADTALQVYFTMSGTAVSNADYTIFPTSPATIPAGQTSIDITVTPVNDSTAEPAETVILTVAAGDYAVGTPSSATATISENDQISRYWDINGVAPGGADASGLANGTWGTDAFWSTDEFGNLATGPWTPGAKAIFSAGFDAWGAYTVTVSGTQEVDSLDFQEGTVTLDGGTLDMASFSATKVASSALIKSVIAGSALRLEGPGNLTLAGANTYAGPTSIDGGVLLVGRSGGAIPDTSAVTIGATGTLDLYDAWFSMGSYDETIGSLAGASGAKVNVPFGNTLTFGGNNTDTLWDGTTQGGGSLTKVGTGMINIGDAGVIAETLNIMGGKVQINTAGDLGAVGNFNPITIDNGAILETTSTDAGVNFVTDRPITIGAGGATMNVTVGTAIVMIHDSCVISGPGILTKDGPGELRTYSAEHSFAKLVVKNGLYTAGHSTSLGYPTSFGAIPVAATADAITIHGGASIRKAGGQNVALDPKQGITLTGAGTKTVRSYAGDANTGTFEIAGTISGTGPLQLPGPTDSGFAPIMVLKGQNTYSDGTIVQPGRVLVINNFTGSGTGTGTVTVNNGATLGGEGSMGGPVVMNGGTLAPGYTYYTGPVPATEVTKPVARLRLTNGLDMGGTAAYNWQLGALSVANPGTDWDQIEVTGGNVTLGSSSVLNVAFTGTATVPNDTDPFWQTSQQWKIISVSGGGSVSGNFSAITGTESITNGTFSTIADATGVTLVWNLGVAPEPVTDMSIGITGTDCTISYSGGAGSKFVLLRSVNVEAPVASWARVATNTAASGTFTFPVGVDPKAFYLIQSE